LYFEHQQLLTLLGIYEAIPYCLMSPGKTGLNDKLKKYGNGNTTKYSTQHTSLQKNGYFFYLINSQFLAQHQPPGLQLRLQMGLDISCILHHIWQTHGDVSDTTGLR